MTIEFTLETDLTDELWYEIIELDSKFWGNTTHVSVLGIEFKPEKQVYQMIANQGNLVMTLGRDTETGQLSCVAVGSLSRYIENPKYLTVDNFVFVVDKGSQSIKTLSKFLTKIEELMKSKGIDLVSFNIPDNLCSKAVKEFFIKKGFIPSMVTFHKRIN